MTDTLTHLHGHHGDFEDFAQLMQQTAAGRFTPVFWGIWQQYIAPALPQQGRVVDLGCGPGGLFAPLRRAHPLAQIVGVEYQPAMLRAAEEIAKSLDITLITADLAKPLPLPDGYADVAVAVMVLHELLDPITLLRDTHRLLRSGGTMLIYDWVHQPLRRYSKGEALNADLLQHFREHCLYTPDDLAFMAENAGFVVQEVIGRKNGDYTMLALTKP